MQHLAFLRNTGGSGGRSLIEMHKDKKVSQSRGYVPRTFSGLERLGVKFPGPTELLAICSAGRNYGIWHSQIGRHLREYIHRKTLLSCQPSFSHSRSDNRSDSTTIEKRSPIVPRVPEHRQAIIWAPMSESQQKPTPSEAPFIFRTAARTSTVLLDSSLFWT
jgi:hypothetical protein